MLEVNQPAPEFSAVNQDETTITLRQYQGEKNVVLYFYPKDDTPGCTIEANEFTALIDDFAAADTVVLGVSKDTCAKHQKLSVNTGSKSNCWRTPRGSYASFMAPGESASSWVKPTWVSVARPL